MAASETPTLDLPAAPPSEGADASPPRFLFARLCVLIFLAFAIMGAFVPVFSLHLKNLGFSAEATAWASGTNALGAMLAPLLWGQIADRWLALQRCISLCALTSGVLLFLLAALDDPGAVFAISLLLWLFLVPVIGLSGAYLFRELAHPEREYGKIRLWGTMGWMAASWCLTLWFAATGWISAASERPDFADSLRLAGVIGLALAVYAWTLPHAPPRAGSDASTHASWLRRAADAPLSALALFRTRTFLVYCACMFGLFVTVPFTVQLNPLLLEQLQVDRSVVPFALTIAQATEVVALALLPVLLMRFGTKATMIGGGAAWALGLTVLWVGEPVALVLAALATHGVFICCFVIAGQVFANRQASDDIRASAQGILIFINGSGLFLGHLLVGWIRDWTEDQFSIAYGLAAILASGLVGLFAIGFSTKAAPAKTLSEILVPQSEIT